MLAWSLAWNDMRNNKELSSESALAVALNGREGMGWEPAGNGQKE